jgi:hypothetical protein
MKVVSFLLGALAGIWATVGFFMSVEVVRAYRENIDQDPWQEYAAEEKPTINVHLEGYPDLVSPTSKPFDWERWKTADELNQERLAKQEFYTREDDETSPEDDDL